MGSTRTFINGRTWYKGRRHRNAVQTFVDGEPPRTDSGVSIRRRLNRPIEMLELPMVALESV